MATPGTPLDQRMAAAEHGDEGLVNERVLTGNDAAKLRAAVGEEGSCGLECGLEFFVQEARSLLGGRLA